MVCLGRGRLGALRAASFTLTNHTTALRRAAGTAKVLSDAGVPCEVVFKIHEGRPNPMDLMKNGDIKMIIMTNSNDDLDRTVRVCLCVWCARGKAVGWGGGAGQGGARWEGAGRWLTWSRAPPQALLPARRPLPAGRQGAAAPGADAGHPHRHDHQRRVVQQGGAAVHAHAQAGHGCHPRLLP